ncbi:ABC transporter permease [Shouchella lonarensis]|uniref:Teichoic acid transport system permease protein n=1 Tax=Shouchella lonarensis TaxID=1464122 RepID=A0A1G6GZP5_9BACI|nr:ABC transporter permease [Shouchella lonarensis]SDB87155.1 teichoic acid transport system permease protein [Shouchella lonarensis]
MRAILQLLKEQYTYRHLIFRLAVFEQRSKFQMHYLGGLWQFFNPVMQASVFFIIFGLGIRGGQPIDGTPYFIWFLCGFIPWFFLRPTILQGANSIHRKIWMVSKMKFPVSVLPSIVIVGNSLSFVVMLAILAIFLGIYSIFSGWYLLQLPYYLLCLYAFLYVFSLLSATLSTVVRDYYQLLEAGMRMLFFLTPIIWVPTTMAEKAEWLLPFLHLNPFFYLLEGFRDTFIGRAWFFSDLSYMAFFWTGILVLAFIGTHVHLKFKNSFVDYL